MEPKGFSGESEGFMKETFQCFGLINYKDSVLTWEERDILVRRSKVQFWVCLFEKSVKLSGGDIK